MPEVAARLEQELPERNTLLTSLAATLTEQTTTFHRRLAAEHPDRTYSLAVSLNNLANRLSEVGRPLESVPVIEEAVGIFRRLASEDPGRPVADLALALSTLTGSYNHIGRLGDAVESGGGCPSPTTDGHGKPGRLRWDLAIALNNLADVYRELGRLDDAIVSTESALRLLERHVTEVGPVSNF